jgi:hypothetical protein
MLEDLFFDALSHFVSAYQPTSELTRPPRGEKGYDYEFDGLSISHKVSKEGPIEIAALWDATVKNVATWTFSTPIAFTNSNYKPKSFKVTEIATSTAVALSPKQVKVRACASSSNVNNGEVAALVHWPNSDTIQVKDVFDITIDGAISEALGFPDIWKKVAVLESSGIPSNEIELLIFPQGTKFNSSTTLKVADSHKLYRPGIYLFAVDQLTNVPIVANNRAQLVPRVHVSGLMTECFECDQFVPLSNWFMSYSGNNPPDLYIAQKQSFDLYFSHQNLAVGVTGLSSKKTN